MIHSWSFRWEASTRVIASALQASSSVQVIMIMLSDSQVCLPQAVNVTNGQPARVPYPFCRGMAPGPILVHPCGTLVIQAKLMLTARRGLRTLLQTMTHPMIALGRTHIDNIQTSLTVVCSRTACTKRHDVDSGCAIRCLFNPVLTDPVPCANRLVACTIDSLPKESV